MVPKPANLVASKREWFLRAWLEKSVFSAAEFAVYSDCGYFVRRRWVVDIAVMGVEVEFTQYFDDNGVKVLVVLVSLIVASSALLEGLAKLDEIKKDVVRQELWKDASTLNKIVGAVATILVASLTFGVETWGVLVVAAVLFTFTPFLVFRLRKSARVAAETKLRDESAKDEERTRLLDALIAAETARVAQAATAAVGPVSASAPPVVISGSQTI
jgi:hypothetical protein